MPAQTDHSPPHPAERRLDLDWIRIAAFGLLILYHVGMLYVSWGFHVKSVHRLRELEPLMLLLNPWRMALLFLVSGAATRFMLGKYEIGAFARRRATRLLIPLAFGMLVVVPPQSFAEVVDKFGFSGGYLDFWFGHYLAFDQSFCRIENGRQACIILPTWNHLWFVAYLFLYTMVLAGLLALAPGLAARGERLLARALPGLLLLIGPALLLGLNRFLIFPVAPPTYVVAGDWYQHVLYASASCSDFLPRAHKCWPSGPNGCAGSRSASPSRPSSPCSGYARSRQANCVALPARSSTGSTNGAGSSRSSASPIGTCRVVTGRYGVISSMPCSAGTSSTRPQSSWRRTG